MRLLSSRAASASWAPGPLRCDVEVDGFRIPVDEPPSAGGIGASAGPTDLLLASVASCFTLALVHSAGKRGLALRDVRVGVVGDYAGRRFDAVHIGVHVIGPTPEELKDLIAAAERACYVTNTLRTAVTITVAAASPRSGEG
ncbi:MAG: OsmC family protein [Jatrophihabitantaceae bacterium]